MTQHGAGRDEYDDVADAVVEERQRLSVVWIIPLIAIVVGAFVAWRVLSARGPEITIAFKSADGLEAGKTKVKFKDVEVGLVEAVVLEKDLSGVICHVRMVAGAETYLRENTRFWIVKPRIAGGQVTGLGTLLSGSYVGMDPVIEGEKVRSFVGLEIPPVVTLQEAGRYFLLRSSRAGAIDPGTPVFFRKIAVGQVVSSALDENSDFVTTRIFVRAPYDQRVHADSRFWNASGFDAQISADGVTINTESIVSILVGGVAFESRDAQGAAVAEAETVFPLFVSRVEADKPIYTRTVAFLLNFDQSVRGLNEGAPVEFRGIEIGEVTDVRLEFDQKTAKFRIPVMIAIEPDRIQGISKDQQGIRRENVDKLVASGLRAQLKSGNLLTGQLMVSLDVFKNAPPAKVIWSSGAPELPTIPTPIEELTASVTQFASKLGKLPIEEIGKDLRASLDALRATLEKSEDIGPALATTLKQVDRTLASVGPDSSVNSELRRALLELSEAARALALAAEQFQTQPSSVIFGKEGSK